MKQTYIIDLKSKAIGEVVNLLGWVKAKRSHSGVIFLDVCDSTGFIQVVVDSTLVTPDLFGEVDLVPRESSVEVRGIIQEVRKEGTVSREVAAMDFNIIGLASKQISPQPRSDINIFDPALVNQLITHRHLYLRNEKVMAILRFRHLLMGAVHQWFRDGGFIEITAPILTPIPLYDSRSALPIQVHEEDIFLTQCVAFYLESAVHAFEKVYNIGPSFRGEESRSKRHLMEYWHIKAEIAFGDFEDIIRIVEDLIAYCSKFCRDECQDISETLGSEICIDGMMPPFPRITYRNAVSTLRSMGIDFEFGTGISSREEELLSSKFSTPFWITGNPRSIEPFPYTINPEDAQVTVTADLIATKGYGELLGVAEKITDIAMLDERLMEKGKLVNGEYEWLREMRELGCVPHVGFGLGVERLIRWFLQIPHVRDTIPFPRIFGRKIHP